MSYAAAVVAHLSPDGSDGGRSGKHASDLVISDDSVVSRRVGRPYWLTLYNRHTR